MIIAIVLALIAIITMLIFILFKPSIKIGKIVIDTFYLPIIIIAIILLVFPIFDKSEFINIIFSNSPLNPIKILILFICVSMISIALDEAGFFSYIATIFINKYKSSQLKLFFVLYLVIATLTVFTSNDIVILTFTPFILYFSKRGKINPIPYLVMEFVAANTYSMILAIGNPTNIYLASAFSLDFISYFLNMLIPSLAIGIASLLTLFLLFRKKLKEPISSFDINKPSITNKPLCIICLIHLILTTILLAVSNYIGLEMWLICLILATSLLIFLIGFSIRRKTIVYVTSTLKRIPYSLIPFILGMFTIIMALDSHNVFDYIANTFSYLGNYIPLEIIYLISSTLSCNIVNNIPMTLAFESILSSTTNYQLVYATIIGSNLGAILTPVGALAGIMWLRILKTNNVKYSFIDFLKNGIIITSIILVVASITLIII